MHGAERVAVAITGWLAAAAVGAYALDAVGLALMPMVIAALATAVAGAIGMRWSASDEPEGSSLPLVCWLAIVSLTLAWMLRPAWPALLPPGRGPDLAHHLLLIDYIERHWRLVHDAALAGSMGEMAAYTPGLHALAVLSGAWTRTDGFRSVYPLVAFTVALKGGFLFLITSRALPRSSPRHIQARVPLAIISVLLALLPRAYFMDAFVHDSFLAQVAAELFAVAMWWAVMAWDDGPSMGGALVVALMGMAAFLTWPIWIGPPVIVCVVMMLGRAGLPWRDAHDACRRRPGPGRAGRARCT